MFVDAFYRYINNSQITSLGFRCAAAFASPDNTQRSRLRLFTELSHQLIFVDVSVLAVSMFDSPSDIKLGRNMFRFFFCCSEVRL